MVSTLRRIPVAPHRTQVERRRTESINDLADQTLFYRTLNEKNAGIIPSDIRYEPGNVLRYGSNDNPLTTDMTSAFQTAFDAAGDGQGVYVPPGDYLIDGVVSCTIDKTHVHFDGCYIEAEDDGTFGTLTNLASGPMVFLFKEADGIHVTGSVEIVGKGTATSSRLAGMVFDECQDVTANYTYYCDNMAAGRMVFWCDNSVFGDISATRMSGTQTFSGVGTAGTAEVVVGCVGSIFGAIRSELNYKPCRYLSVAANASSAYIDNERCIFGPITGSSEASSQEGSVLSIRSGVNCQHGPINGSGFRAVLLVNALSGDATNGNTIDNNQIESVDGESPGSAASLDGVIIQDAQSGESIGTTTIGQAICEADGEVAVYCNDGTLTIGTCIIKGDATRGLQLLNCNINFGQLIIQDVDKQPVQIGQGVHFSCEDFQQLVGYTTAQTAVITYDTSIGTGDFGSVRINRIYYNSNGVGTDYTYIILDQTHGPHEWDIGLVQGSGSGGQCRFGSDNYTRLEHGWANSGTAPTTATFSAGDVIYDESPSASGSIGNVCVTSGSFSTATDNTGDTDGSTEVITGMTDTSDFFLGQYVTVSAGFPSATTPYKILALTSTTMSLNTDSTSVQSNVTVSTPNPVFKTFGSISA